MTLMHTVNYASLDEAWAVPETAKQGNRWSVCDLGTRFRDKELLPMPFNQTLTTKHGSEKPPEQNNENKLDAEKNVEDFVADIEVSDSEAKTFWSVSWFNISRDASNLLLYLVTGILVVLLMDQFIHIGLYLRRFL